jgi:hemerythrin-like metal-binding protein
MPIEWTESLSTGSYEIDAQHQRLFKQINSMMEACNRGRGRSEVTGALQFLEDYVSDHFGTEERWMAQHRYPAYAEHRAEHREFIAKVQELSSRVEEGETGIHTVIATNQLMVYWFLVHIRTVDVKLGAFLKSREV